MTFELLKTIDLMIDLYGKPRNFQRFQEYIKLLHGGTKADVAIPISGFNPMGKEHLINKLLELKNLRAEQIIAEMLTDLNSTMDLKNINRSFKVAINLLDDLGGGWTNRFTSDYDSKFKFSGLFSRNFCIPIFWSSERLTENIIKARTREYIFRTIYWLTEPKPKTLKGHLQQEIFVARQGKTDSGFVKADFTAIDKFYKDNENTDNFHLIFNFFYGDKASASLAFPNYGFVENVTGFDYSKWRISG